VSSNMTRREFLGKGAAGAAGMAMAMAAAGPLAGRVLGANDRVRIGVVGPGDRAHGLMQECAKLCGDLNMELVASCDIWNKARERGAATIKALTGRDDVIQCRNLEEICERDDIDALIIATADFQHAQHMAYAVRAGKDVYVEKPLANDLDDAKDALKAVQETGRIVQIGTQRRSEGSWPAAAEFIASGALGKVSYVEQSWNYFGPRWRRGDVESQIREEDTDWKRFLLNRPYRPFNAHCYREFRLYWPFSSGIPCQWLSHSIDAIQWIMGDLYPTSCVAHGGVYVWRDGRENADTFHVLLEYPGGYLVSYSTRFGNDSDLGSGGPMVYGTNGRLDVPSLTATGDGGGGAVTIIERPHEPHEVKIDPSRKIGDAIKLQPKPGMSHMRNWMECVRSRKTPNADVTAGYSHSIPVIMAIKSLHSGRRICFDPQTHTITEG